jgi:hypothetical protein
MLKVFRCLLAWVSFLLVPEELLLFSFNDVDTDVLGALDGPAADLTFNGPDGLPLLGPRPLLVPLSGAEVVDFLFADGFGLLAAAALRRCRALSSLGSLRVSNALHVFLTQ